MRVHRRIATCLLLATCLLAASAFAADENICEFKLGPGSNALRVVTLSESVYACMRNSDYRDIRVLNGDGNSVPLHIIHPSSQRSMEDYRAALEFNIDSVDTNHRYYQHLQRLVRSTTYSKNSTAYEFWVAQQVFQTAIIVENPNRSADLYRLHVELDHQGRESINATAYLEYSDDLIHWRASSLPQKLFYKGKNVARLSQPYLRLGANRKSRYIRIVLLSTSSHFTDMITQIEGMYQRDLIINPQYLWTEASSIQQLGNGQDWQFSMPNQLPISRLRFKPENGIILYSGELRSKPINREVPEDNTYLREAGKDRLKQAIKRVVTGQKRSFESINSGWGYPIRFQQYHFEAADSHDVTRTPEPVSFAHSPSRHWRITFEHPSSAMIASRFPQVEFGWTAAAVRFLAQGPEPFSLRVGLSDTAAGSKTPPLLRRSTESFETVALLSAPPELSGPATTPNTVDDTASRTTGNQPRASSSEAPSNSQTIIWIVMILGVLVMGYMAWQLLRSIDSNNENESN